MGVLTADWPRRQKVVLWTLGAVAQLESAGLIASAYTLQPGGREALEELEAEGFEPTDAEMHAALSALMSYDDEA